MDEVCTLSVSPPFHNWRDLDVSILVPAYNEQESPSACVTGLDQTMAHTGLRTQIVVVDDGSDDGTSKVAAGIRTTLCELKIITQDVNLGKTAALRSGLEYARAGIIVILDADLQYDPGDVPRLISGVMRGFAGVNAWGVPRQDPWSKKLPSMFSTWMVRQTSSIPTHDANSGLKAFRAEALQRIDFQGDDHRYLLPLLSCQGYAITEIPVRHYPRTRGKSKIGPLRLINGTVTLAGKKGALLFGWKALRPYSEIWNFTRYRLWNKIRRTPTFVPYIRAVHADRA
jgi:glycosyltransferase involved in cell wall biosynthesis